MTLVLTQEEYLRQIINIKTTKETNCSITTDKIETMEPHLSIFNELKISELGAKKLQKNLENIENKYINIKKYKNECDFCGDYKDTYSITIKGEKKYEAISYCEECMKLFSRKCRELIQKIQKEYFYHDDSGFSVKEYKSKEQIYDIIQREKISTKLVVDLGFHDNMLNHKLGISNVEDFIQRLRKKERLEDNVKTNECHLCGKNKKEIFYIKEINSKMCRECKNKMSSRLEKFIREQKDYIISRLI